MGSDKDGVHVMYSNKETFPDTATRETADAAMATYWHSDHTEKANPKKIQIGKHRSPRTSAA